MDKEEWKNTRTCQISSRKSWKETSITETKEEKGSSWEARVLLGAQTGWAVTWGLGFCWIFEEIITKDRRREKLRCMRLRKGPPIYLLLSNFCAGCYSDNILFYGGIKRGSRGVGGRLGEGGKSRDWGVDPEGVLLVFVCLFLCGWEDLSMCWRIRQIAIGEGKQTIVMGRRPQLTGGRWRG